MLRALHIKDVGPAARFDLELGERLNVLTGDNGLGKSFVLEVAWWALTGTWTDRPVLPHRGKEEGAQIAGEVAYALKWDRDEQTPRDGAYRFEATFNRLAQSWDDRLPDRARDGWVHLGRGVKMAGWLGMATPVLYARTNGAFSLWDPARGQAREGTHGHQIASVEAYHFGERELWDGLQREGKTLCNGLIQDWVTWQLEAVTEDEAHPFHLLRRVLEQLSHPDEPMLPGKPVRLYRDEVRRIPTIDLPYETGVPVVHTSAGMRKILALSYMLVWAWTEHVQASRIIGWPPADRMVVLLEEPETHLHPKWQRYIVPALLRVLAGLTPGAPEAQGDATTGAPEVQAGAPTDAPEAQTGAPEMRPQVLVTTHAPLVLASLEPHFDVARDKLFSFCISATASRLSGTETSSTNCTVVVLTQPALSTSTAGPRSSRAPSGSRKPSSAAGSLSEEKPPQP